VFVLKLNKFCLFDFSNYVLGFRYLNSFVDFLLFEREKFLLADFFSAFSSFKAFSKC
jgi:hypothetical protein